MERSICQKVFLRIEIFSCQPKIKPTRPRHRTESDNKTRDVGAKYTAMIKEWESEQDRQNQKILGLAGKDTASELENQMEDGR